MEELIQNAVRSLDSILESGRSSCSSSSYDRDSEFSDGSNMRCRCRCRCRCRRRLNCPSPAPILPPPDLLDRCRGIAIFSVTDEEGGCGSGIVMARYHGWDEWSPPSAADVRGIGTLVPRDFVFGFGFGLGRNSGDSDGGDSDTRRVLIALITHSAFFSSNGDHHLRVESYLLRGSHMYEYCRHPSSPSSSTCGGGGGGGGGGGVASPIRPTLETSVLSMRNDANERFYGRNGITPADILCRGHASAPLGSGVTQLHCKLRDLIQTSKIVTRRRKMESLSNLPKEVEMKPIRMTRRSEDEGCKKKENDDDDDDDEATEVASYAENANEDADGTTKHEYGYEGRG